jgi:electron transfer flavoprotein alpha subunit/NAD-dependent dihydropyrimidine dehydrogenase PreA subunit
MNIWVNKELCNECKRCLRACPYQAIEMVEGKAFITDRCTLCGTCVEVCKEKAIISEVPTKEIPDFSQWKDVWVFVEQKDGKVLRVGLELLGKAQELAKALGEKVVGVVLGHNVAKEAEILLRYGAQIVYVADAPELDTYSTLPYTRVLSGLVKAHRPSILLIGATVLGRDLAPRLSRRLGAGLTADCTELSIDLKERILLQTRPAFGGNIMATIANRFSRPQMATVRPGVMEAKEADNPRGEVINVEVNLEPQDLVVELIKYHREAKAGVDLTEAKVIVAGGRGMGDKEGFESLWELAHLLKGEVAGTRVAVEEGWIPQNRQVGQTGVTVRPELYIACGISGAIQHRAGMMNSRYIIAINKDPQAPIFQVADWGIVGDVREVVPLLTQELRDRFARG